MLFRSGYVAGGVSVATNNISGDTTAKVINSTITASGNDQGFEITEKSKEETGIENEKEDIKGLVINANAEHKLENVVVTAGVAVTKEVAVGAAGTLTFTNISGATNALLTDTTVNYDNSAITDTSDVSVIASDSTTLKSVLTTVAGGVGVSAGGGGLGEASDSIILNRDSIAKIGNTTTKTLNANELYVSAFNSAEMTSTATGIAFGGGIYGAGAIGGTVSSLKTNSKTLAEIAGVNGTNNGVGEIGRAHV